MNLSLFLTLVVSCGVSVVYSQAVNSTWWPCRNLTHQHDMDLDQAVGVWYQQEMIIPFEYTSEVCTATKFIRTTTGVLAVPSKHNPGGNHPNQTIVVDPANPGLWYNSGYRIPMMILDQPKDNETLAITACTKVIDPTEFTMVFSRSRHIDDSKLNAVHKRLRQAGVNYIQKKSRIDQSNCREYE